MLARLQRHVLVDDVRSHLRFYFICARTCTLYDRTFALFVFGHRTTAVKVHNEEEASSTLLQANKSSIRPVCLQVVINLLAQLVAVITFSLCAYPATVHIICKFVHVLDCAKWPKPWRAALSLTDVRYTFSLRSFDEWPAE